MHAYSSHDNFVANVSVPLLHTSCKPRHFKKKVAKHDDFSYCFLAFWNNKITHKKVSSIWSHYIISSPIPILECTFAFNYFERNNQAQSKDTAMRNTDAKFSAYILLKSATYHPVWTKFMYDNS